MPSKILKNISLHEGRKYVKFTVTLKQKETNVTSQKLLWNNKYICRMPLRNPDFFDSIEREYLSFNVQQCYLRETIPFRIFQYPGYYHPCQFETALPYLIIIIVAKWGWLKSVVFSFLQQPAFIWSLSLMSGALVQEGQQSWHSGKK